MGIGERLHKRRVIHLAAVTVDGKPVEGLVVDGKVVRAATLLISGTVERSSLPDFDRVPVVVEAGSGSAGLVGTLEADDLLAGVSRARRKL